MIDSLKIIITKNNNIMYIDLFPFDYQKSRYKRGYQELFWKNSYKTLGPGYEIDRPSVDHSLFNKKEDGSYESKINLAGTEKEDIEVSIENNILEVTTATKTIKHPIPKTADISTASADYKNGILTIKISPSKESEKKVLEIN